MWAYRIRRCTNKGPKPAFKKARVRLVCEWRAGTSTSKSAQQLHSSSSYVSANSDSIDRATHTAYSYPASCCPKSTLTRYSWEEEEMRQGERTPKASSTAPGEKRLCPVSRGLSWPRCACNKVRANTWSGCVATPAATTVGQLSHTLGRTLSLAGWRRRQIGAASTIEHGRRSARLPRGGPASRRRRRPAHAFRASHNSSPILSIRFLYTCVYSSCSTKASRAAHLPNLHKSARLRILKRRLL